MMNAGWRTTVKGTAAAMAVAGLLTLGGPARAVLPTGEQFRHERPTIARAGNTMTITQTTHAAKIDWDGFNIGRDHAVRIVQPTTDAFIVNRVTGSALSQIDGTLSANGRVYLINPNGITFGETAQVNVGGLVASTHRLANDAMTNDSPPLSLESSDRPADLYTLGAITVAKGGVLTMASAANLYQDGTLRAPEGTIGLSVSPKVNLEEDGSVSRTIGKSAADHAMNIGGTIEASQGSLEIRSERGRINLPADIRPVARTLMEVENLESAWGGVASLTTHLSKWLDGGSKVTVDTGQRELIVRSPIKAAGTPESQLTLRSGSKITLDSTIDMERGDVELDAVLGSIAMSPSARIKLKEGALALGSYPIVMSSTSPVLTLSTIEVNDLRIRSPIHPALNLQDKDFDGLTTASVISGPVTGIKLLPDSNLTVRLTYQFEDAAPGSNKRVNGTFHLNGFNGEKTFEKPSADEYFATIHPPTFPTGFNRKFGDVDFRNEGTRFVVTQRSDVAKVDWETFDIGRHGAVQFEQPNANALIVNRVAGAAPSQIDGSLTANGRVYLINPNGITFGKSAQVNVGGFMASTHNVSDEAMKDASSGFTLMPGDARLDQQGSIAVAEGGVLTLASSGQMEQSGTLVAPAGAIHIAAVEKVALADTGKIAAVDGRFRRLDHTGTSSAKEGELNFGAGPVVLGSNRPQVHAPVQASKLSLRSPVTASFTAKNKIYDGTTVADVDGAKHSGIDFFEGSNLRLVPSYGFDSADAGERTVTASMVLTGFNGDATTPINVVDGQRQARIEPRPLDLQVAPVRKPFDGTLAAPVSIRPLNAIAGSDVAITYRSAEFHSSEPGERAVTVSGLALTGRDAGSYRLREVELATTGVIEPRSAVVPGKTAPVGPDVPLGPKVPVDPAGSVVPAPSAETTPSIGGKTPALAGQPGESATTSRAPLAARRAIACEQRRSVASPLNCGRAFIEPPGTAASAVRWGGIRLPAETPAPRPQR